MKFPTMALGTIEVGLLSVTMTCENRQSASTNTGETHYDKHLF